MGLISRVSSRTYRHDFITMARCLVLGGGISSLSFAHYLSKKHPKISIKLLEQKPTTGGWLKTFRHDNNTLSELGPRSIPIARKNQLQIKYSSKPTSPIVFSPEAANMKMLIHDLNLRGSLLPSIEGETCMYGEKLKKCVKFSQLESQKTSDIRLYLKTAIKLFRAKFYKQKNN